MQKQKCKIFIDESSHLENDGHYNMCIGYIQVPEEKYNSLKQGIRNIQLKYHSPFELKWNKFSKSRLNFYKALVDYFFNTDLSFRCVLVKPKERLNNIQFNQGSHDNFYYKMVYFLIKNSIKDYYCSIYLDIKDTRGRQKLKKIEDIFQSEMREKKPFERIQHLRSEDNVFIQLADFFIGAVSYKDRANHENFTVNEGKQEFITYLEEKSGFCLDDGTPPWEEKFNIFDFQPRKS